MLLPGLAVARALPLASIMASAVANVAPRLLPLQVAGVRCAHVTGRDGSQQPKMIVVDVWRLQGGQVGRHARTAVSQAVRRSWLAACMSAFSMVQVKGAARNVCCRAGHSIAEWTRALCVRPCSHAQVVSANQCWQLMRGPAGDDIEITPEEGRTAELVRTALAALQVCEPARLASTVSQWGLAAAHDT